MALRHAIGADQGARRWENDIDEENDVNPKRRRLTIVLAAVGAIGAIAAIATAASLALFYDPTAPAPVTFETGNVTLNSSTSQTCDFSGLYPGSSTPGEPNGDHTLTPCTLTFEYVGTLQAYLGLDVSVTSTANTGANYVADCNGGNADGTQACQGLYNPSVGAPNNQDDGIQVNVDGNGSPGSNAQAFGIGNDQTIWESDSTDIAGANSNYTETYTVDVYWPLDTGSTAAANQNAYTGASAKVTLTEHSVQEADNALTSCTPIDDTTQATFGTNEYFPPNQPTEGWGAGFNSGTEAAGSQYPVIGGCPSVNDDATTWTSSTPETDLLPFYHPND
jgi:hypothetical protein